MANAQLLTDDDINVLLTALECYEKSGTMENMMGDLLTTLLVKDEEERELLKKRQGVDSEKLNNELRVKKNRSIMIASKLLQMKEALA